MTKLRDPKVSLHDILECANNCIGFTKDMSFEEYGADIKTVSAVLHQIMIIGEAAKRLGTKFTDEHPSVPWREMAGMRDILIHHYEDSDLAISWSVVQNELPKIANQIEIILEQI
jgi:uncharacterized protein with HEPN domain